MKPTSYTVLIAAGPQGKLRKLHVSVYFLYLMVVLAFVGGITVLGAMGSYTRMLWKVANYNEVRGERDTLKVQFKQMQTMVKDTNRQLSSLQSLATDVAMSYGIVRFRQTPFGLAEAPLASQAAYEQAVDRFNFLVRNASAVAVVGQGLRLMPGRSLEDLAYIPSIWPVMGRLTGGFGERMDPFSGEGAFHAGVDISSYYGDAVRATADGIVVEQETRAGYGRLVVIEHGFGISTWYGHLSRYATRVGAQVKRGEVIGYEGATGRATAPHVHYEVRLYGNPVNPWRYLRGAPSIGD
jgi:murein DD-endopeptidase MepM/ murein hydrolase activator NlpD